MVIRVKEDGVEGRMEQENISSQGNNIVIQHSDNSRSGYWHLQKDGALVNVGDTVKQGQIIGLSGKTGYAATTFTFYCLEIRQRISPSGNKISNFKRNKIFKAIQ